MILGYNNLPHHQPNAKEKDIAPYNWSKQLTTATDKEDSKYTGTLPPLEGMLYSENQFRKQNADLFYITAVQGHSGARQDSTAFALTPVPRVDLRKRALHYRLRKVRARHQKEKRGRTKRLSMLTKDDMQFTSRTPSTLGQVRKMQGLENTKSHHDADLLWTWKARRKRTSRFHQRLNGCVICFTIPKEYIKKSHPPSTTADANARIRGAVAHILSKRATVTKLWSKRRRFSHVKGYRQKIFCLTELCSRQKFHTQVATHLTTQRTLATPDRDVL